MLHVNMLRCAMRSENIIHVFAIFTVILLMVLCAITIRILPCARFKVNDLEFEDVLDDNDLAQVNRRTNALHAGDCMLKNKAQCKTLGEFINRNNRNAMNRSAVNSSNVYGDSSIAVVVPACNRVTVYRCLETLLKFRTSAERFPIIVSQGCRHDMTTKVIQSFGDQILYISQPELEIHFNETDKFEGYGKIASHYVNVLNLTFFEFGFNYAVIVEDDLEVSCDFFEYFLGTLPVLRADPTLMCVSAWNDNGRPRLIQTNAPEMLHRTDFFPGLGWMLSKLIWLELAPKWPKRFWDDWIRNPMQMKGRACIRPEISRTKHFGGFGVSTKPAIFHRRLKSLVLNQQFVPFTKLNLTYLLKSNYDKRFLEMVSKSKVVSLAMWQEDLEFWNGTRAIYCDTSTFNIVANRFGLMKDFRGGVPRTAYKGIVSFFYINTRIYVIIRNLLPSFIDTSEVGKGDKEK